jgi:hypothetical protein
MHPKYVPEIQMQKEISPKYIVTMLFRKYSVSYLMTLVVSRLCMMDGRKRNE